MSLEVASLRATAHPIRLRILSLLSGTSMSAADIARELGITQANASYHVRVLAAAQLLEESGSATVRGGVAKLYTHRWDRPPPLRHTEPQAMIAAMAQELVRRSAQPSVGRHTLTDAELWVEPEAWAEVVDAVYRASHRLHAAARPPRTDGTVRVTMTAALFEMADDAVGDAAP